MSTSWSTQRLGSTVLHRGFATPAHDTQSALRQVVESSWDMIARHGGDGAFLSVSPACERLLGLPPQAVTGRSIFEFCHPDDGEALRLHFLGCFAGLRGGEATFRMRRNDGAYIWAETSAAPVIDQETGKVVEVVTVTRDITQRQEVLFQLEAARDAAERADRAKTRFLAAASHDLRQPLAAMGLFLSALGNRVREPAALPMIEQMRASMDSLADLFNALLELSRLEAGITVPVVKSFPLAPLLLSLQTEYRGQAAAKGLRLSCVPCAVSVRSDRQLLERILRNLLTNAIKYTQRGRLVVGCRRVPGAVRLEVWDTGIGIPAGELEVIFEEFRQVRSSSGDSSEGLGLGLAIVNRLAALLGHRIDVKSTLNKGSMFAVTVPMDRQQTPHLEAHDDQRMQDERLRGKLVLIIEDDAAILEGMDWLLRSWGCETITANSSDAAIMTLSRQKRRPDIILSDYRLTSDITGADAITWVRAHLKAPIPAIIITGDTAPVRLREAAAGGNALLHKPIKLDELRALMLKLCDSAKRPADASR